MKNIKYFIIRNSGLIGVAIGWIGLLALILKVNIFQVFTLSEVVISQFTFLRQTRFIINSILFSCGISFSIFGIYLYRENIIKGKMFGIFYFTATFCEVLLAFFPMQCLSALTFTNATGIIHFTLAAVLVGFFPFSILVFGIKIRNEHIKLKLVSLTASLSTYTLFISTYKYFKSIFLIEIVGMFLGSIWIIVTSLSIDHIHLKYKQNLI